MSKLDLHCAPDQRSHRQRVDATSLITHEADTALFESSTSVNIYTKPSAMRCDVFQYTLWYSQMRPGCLNWIALSQPGPDRLSWYRLEPEERW